MYTIDDMQRLWDEHPENRVKVTKSTLVNDIVKEKPQDLVSVSKAPADAYSLARCLASEGYSGPSSEKARAAIAIAQTIKNRAEKAGVSIVSLLTNARFPDGRTAPGKGSYGRQGSKTAGYRYAATSQDPTVWHVAIAYNVLTEQLPDVAGGATSFLDPSVFVAGKQGSVFLRKFADVIQKWAKEGTAWIGLIPGIDSFYLMLFKKEPDESAVKESVKNALAAYQAKTRTLVASNTSKNPKGSGRGLLMGAAALGLGYLLFRRG